MSIWWSLHLRRDAASVPLARRLLMGAMDTAGVDPDISYDLALALSEACANAVEHGGPPGPGTTDGSTGGYRVTAYLDGELCRIEVVDAGPGFPGAHAVPEPCFLAGPPGPATVRGAPPAQAPVMAVSAPGARAPSVLAPAEFAPADLAPADLAPADFAPVALAQMPSPDEAESGRGLCLIRELADHMELANASGSGGAVVSFDKILKWRMDAPLLTA